MSSHPTADACAELAGRYLSVTPAGAYFSVAARDADPARTLLLQLLAEERAPRCDIDWLKRGQDNSAHQLATLERLLGLGWLVGLEQQEVIDEGSLEKLLPELLPQVSSQGRALLADQQGLQIGYAGFSESQAAGLAALSSDAVALSQRYRQLVHASEGQYPGAWAMVDAAGNSRIGVWPLFLPERWFALVIAGRPLFTRSAFQRLVWTLAHRFGGIPIALPTGTAP
jgi:hypothetical protein